MVSTAGLKSRIDSFLHTPYYIIVAAALSLAAHLLSAELAAYGLLAAVAVYACLWGSDLLPIAPLFLFCYILPSAANNPGRNEASVFSSPWLPAIAILLVCAVAVFVIRNYRRFVSVRYRLLPGMLVLCVGYLLSGIGSAAYPDSLKQNLLYCFLQCACLVLPYVLLCGGVCWEKAQKNYLSWIGVCGGFLILLQLIRCYLTGEIIADGAIVRTNIYTGWGMYNNLGAMLGMMLPFAFSLGLSYRKDWLGILIGSIFLGGILLTCSRAGILAGGLIFCLCFLLLVRYSKKRLQILLILFLFVGAVLTVLIIMRQTLAQWFADLIRRGLDPHTRDEIYAKGFELFKQAPVFGNSFFSPGYKPWDFSTVDSFSAIIPPRWHNTIIQLLVSAGVVGLVAYLVHRIDTVVFFLKRRSRENSYILCSIIVLLVTSLLDCHFFNLGPVLFYSTALAFAQNQA